jgi:hypothetical protein
MAIKHANFASTTLAAAITTTDGTSITVTSEAGFPAVDFIISIDTEVLLVTNVATTTWTVTRGYEGSTAATHLNGATIFHDWSAAEADSTVHGPASATDAHLAVFDSTTGKLIKDGGAATAAGLALLDDANAAAQIATLGLDADIATLSLPANTTITAAGAALLDDAAASNQLTTLGALPLAGGTMTGNLIMDNMDVTLVKLLTLHGEIDDSNSGTAKTIDWNAGTAHKSTLTGNVTFAFTGYGTSVATGGTATEDAAGAAPEADAFDNNVATYWLSATNLPRWVKYQLPTAKTVIAYGIYTYNNTDYVVFDWTLAGSNNGTDWTTLDTVTNGFTSGQISTWGYFNVDTPASYLYYRLTVTRNNGGTRVAINELGLYDSATISPPAPCFLTLKLVQDGTGGRTVTWPATVKGTPAINLAINAVSNVLFYFDGTNYWTLNGKQFVSATDKVLGRSTAGAGEIEEIACTAAGRAILDDANAAAQLVTLGAMSDWVAAPAAANSAGTAGQKAYASGFFYVCVAASTWQRVAIATWA